ncbi:MAG: Inosine-5'-monophosphate dehydrogenase [Anaerolineae bacterium]|nr:Inosine-5'-monophosphate dehydrogenase [Anaerolineae bacterium]
MTDDLFKNEAYTFDDALLLPGFSEVLPAEVDVRTRLVRDIWLNVPVVSAAMDTVTEARLAIALAREGGIGVIHRNMSIAEQAEQVDQVKRSEAGMITNPITLHPHHTLADAEAIMGRYHISGIPITDADGSGRLVGILTNRDVRFTKNLNQPISEFMVSKNLITASVETTLEEAQRILQVHRIEKLPLVDETGILKGLITVKDIMKKIDYPNAATDAQGRLRVAAAIGVGVDYQERAAALVAAGVDVLAIDTAHGHSRKVVEAVRWVRANFPNTPVMGGNVATAEGARALIEAGVEAIKVGVGAGSICTTRIIAGIGVPQLSAVAQCARAAAEYNIPVIADGGIRYSGDAVKALAAGGAAVMLGSVLAGVEEAPGDIILYEGRRYKDYRGMGSIGAMTRFSKDRYGTGQTSDSGKTVPEGVEGRVPFKGHLRDLIFQFVGGIRSGMGYVGAESLPDMQQKAKFVRISHAGLIESHVHDIMLTKQAPNYSPQ